MKKILMGLIAVTSLSFAAQPNIAGNSGDGTTVFLPTANESGRIVVNGTLTTVVKPSKYVVYATTTGSDAWAGATDVVDLPPFVLSQTSLENKFDTSEKQMPTVYVRKVNADENGVEALTNEKVVFTFEQDAAYTGLPEDLRSVSMSEKYAIPVTSVLAKSTLDKIISNPLVTALGTAFINQQGYIVIDSKMYTTPNWLYIEQSKLGELTIGAETYPDYDTYKLSPENSKVVENVIVSGNNTLTNIAIKVTIS